MSETPAEGESAAPGGHQLGDIDVREDAEGDVARGSLSPAQFWHYYQRYPYLLAKVALWGSLIAGLWWALTNVESVLFPVLVSMLIAYLLDPAVDWVEAKFDRVPFFARNDMGRTIAIGAFLFVILLALTGFVLVLYPAIAAQIGKVTQRFPELVTLVQTNLIPWIERTFNYQLPEDISSAVEQYGAAVREQLPSIAERVSTWAGTVLTQTGAVAASILNLVMIPLFTFYFLRDFDRMTASMEQFVPTHHQSFYLRRIRLMDEVVGAWFRGQVTVALILAVLYSLGLGIVFGVTGIGAMTGVAIGILAGVLNVIPYFGFLIGFVLSLLMVLLDWGGLGPVIAVVAVFTVVQLMEGYYITPRVVGEKVGLSPVVVIIVLLLGGELFGLLGVLLAIPIAGIVRVLLPDFIQYYKKTPFYSGNYATDEAVARAMRTASVAQPDPDSDGLAEQTDGTLNADDLRTAGDTETEPTPDTSKLKRPVTDTEARAAERVEQAPPAMDVGTDGDPEEDGEKIDETPGGEGGEGPPVDDAGEEE